VCVLNLQYMKRARLLHESCEHLVLSSLYCWQYGALISYHSCCGYTLRVWACTDNRKTWGVIGSLSHELQVDANNACVHHKLSVLTFRAQIVEMYMLFIPPWVLFFPYIIWKYFCTYTCYIIYPYL
jgi:hypothetical protein